MRGLRGMSKKQRDREEPKLDINDLEKGDNVKKWPTDDQRDDEVSEPQSERDAEISGILEHPSYKELEKKLTDMEDKANEYWNQQLRSQAELDNVRRRAERDVSNAYKYSLEKFIMDLLPVVDSLDRALESDVSDNEFALKIHQGIELTMSLLLKALEKYGVKQISPMGEPFNPELHQAISTQETSDFAPNSVITVLQKGYTLNDRLIRPALVVVAK